MRSLSDQPAPLRLLAFIGLLALLWLPVYGVVNIWVVDANTASIIYMAGLFFEFLGLTQWWGRQVHGCDRPFHRYGLHRSRQAGYSFLLGLSVGALSLFLLFWVQWWLGWIVWSHGTEAAPSVADPFRLAMEGLLVALGVALGEELVFRGWLLDELERDYSPAIALGWSSVLFAGLHFIRPLGEIIRTFPQFPGLVVLGLLLVWAKRSQGGQLSIAIGLHAGLVWGYYLVNVGQWVDYQAIVSEWWSGVDQNPLAGGLGLGFLAILALWFRWRAIVANRLAEAQR